MTRNPPPIAELEAPIAEDSVRGSESEANVDSGVESRSVRRLRRWVIVEFPNGRRRWLSIRPASATLRQLRDLAEELRQRQTARAKELREQRRAIHALAEQLLETQERLNKQRLTKLKAWDKRFAESQRRLERQLCERLKRQALESERCLQEVLKAAEAQHTRGLVDHLVVFSGLPAAVAYGQKGSLLAPNNLTIALSLMVWLLGDDLLRFLEGKGFQATSSVDLWSVVAPFGNALSTWLLLGNRQRQGMLAGSVSLGDFSDITQDSFGSGAIVYTYRAVLEPRQIGIAPDYVYEFRGLSKVPTYASVSALRARSGAIIMDQQVLSEVRRGELRISVVVVTPSTTAPLTVLDVAWLVNPFVD